MGGEVVSHVQSKLSRGLYTHRGKKLLQNFENVENTALKRAMVRFRGGREKGVMAFVVCLQVSQEDAMQGILWRKSLRRRSLEVHDAAKRVDEMCHGGNGNGQETTHPPPRYILNENVIEISHPQLSAPPGSGSVSSREQSTVFY